MLKTLSPRPLRARPSAAPTAHPHRSQPAASRPSSQGRETQVAGHIQPDTAADGTRPPTSRRHASHPAAAPPRPASQAAPGKLTRDADGVNFTMRVGSQIYRISFYPQAPTQADLDEVSQVMARLMTAVHDVSRARGLRPARITFADGRARIYGQMANGSSLELQLSRQRQEGFDKQLDIVERGLDELRRIFDGRVRFSAERVA